MAIIHECIWTPIEKAVVCGWGAQCHMYAWLYIYTNVYRPKNTHTFAIKIV